MPAAPAVSTPNRRAGNKQTLNEAFPDIEPGARPFGDRVLVQLRSPKRVTSGGIILSEDTRDSEKWMSTIGKIIALGPLAFRDRKNMLAWPEGIWGKEGDYVRCPKWGGDRWEISTEPGDPNADVARFVIFRDHELVGEITGDPLSFIDYV